jgi:hypothetical protein
MVAGNKRPKRDGLEKDFNKRYLNFKGVFGRHPFTMYITQ